MSDLLRRHWKVTEDRMDKGLTASFNITSEVRDRITDLERQLQEAQEKAFKAGYHTGHDHTVEGYFHWCKEGTDDVYRDWLQDMADEAQQENQND